MDKFIEFYFYDNWCICGFIIYTYKLQKLTQEWKKENLLFQVTNLLNCVLTPHKGFNCQHLFFFSYSLKHLFLVWAMPFIANIHNIWNASSKVSVGMRSHDCDSFTIDTQTHTAYCCITLATPLSACLSIRFVSNDLKKNSCCNFTEWERSFGCCEDGRTFKLKSETIFETITS